MSRDNRGSNAAAGPGACGLLPTTVEALEGPGDGAMTGRAPAGRRLLRVLVVDGMSDREAVLAEIRGRRLHGQGRRGRRIG